MDGQGRVRQQDGAQAFAAREGVRFDFTYVRAGEVDTLNAGEVFKRAGFDARKVRGQRERFRPRNRFEPQAVPHGGKVRRASGMAGHGDGSGERALGNVRNAARHEHARERALRGERARAQRRQRRAAQRLGQGEERGGSAAARDDRAAVRKLVDQPGRFVQLRAGNRLHVIGNFHRRPAAFFAVRRNAPAPAVGGSLHRFMYDEDFVRLQHAAQLAVARARARAQVQRRGHGQPVAGKRFGVRGSVLHDEARRFHIGRREVEPCSVRRRGQSAVGAGVVLFGGHAALPIGRGERVGERFAGRPRPVAAGVFAAQPAGATRGLQKRQDGVRLSGCADRRQMSAARPGVFLRVGVGVRAGEQLVAAAVQGDGLRGLRVVRQRLPPYGVERRRAVFAEQVARGQRRLCGRFVLRPAEELAAPARRRFGCDFKGNALGLRAGRGRARAAVRVVGHGIDFRRAAEFLPINIHGVRAAGVALVVAVGRNFKVYAEVPRRVERALRGVGQSAQHVAHVFLVALCFQLILKVAQLPLQTFPAFKAVFLAIRNQRVAARVPLADAVGVAGIADGLGIEIAFAFDVGQDAARRRAVQPGVLREVCIDGLDVRLRVRASRRGHMRREQEREQEERRQLSFHETSFLEKTVSFRPWEAAPKRARQRRFEFERPPRQRMQKAHIGGMQREAPGQCVRPLGSIQKIAEHRTADVGKMHANLMRAPRVQLQPQKRAAVSGFQRPVRRTGGLAVRAHFAANRRAVRLADGRVDNALRLGRYAVRHGQIFARELGRVQLAGQKHLRMRVLRRDHQAAGAPVQPVHRAKHEARHVPIAPCKPVFQRVVRLTGRGLRGKRRGLVDHVQIVVLIKDGNRRVLRTNRHGGLFFIDQRHRDHLSGAHGMVGMHAFAVQTQRAQRLRARQLMAGNAQPPAGDAANQLPVVLRRNHIAQYAHEKPSPSAL